jgi:tellurite resistance protein
MSAPQAPRFPTSIGAAPAAAGLMHLQLVWFGMVMGLSGLALAWLRAQALMGPMALSVATAIGVVAALVWLILLAATAVRARRYAGALRADLAHPVRHAFVAALVVGALLLCAWGVQLWGPLAGLDALWRMSAAAELAVTLWVLGRWLHEHQEGSPPMWAAITPVLFIPVVGNVVVPLAGWPLGHHAWSMAQLGIGVFFWPLVLVLVLARRAAHSALPTRLLMSWFITAAPPSVVGVVSVVMDAPLTWSMGLWGVAMFSLLWASQVVGRAMSAGFHMGFWAVSFPLAAFTSLTLMLAERSGVPWMSAAGLALLALSTLVIGALLVATLKGLRDGTLLVAEPEPVKLPPA